MLSALFNQQFVLFADQQETNNIKDTLMQCYSFENARRMYELIMGKKYFKKR
jgi:hypothetical protein